MSLNTTVQVFAASVSSTVPGFEHAHVIRTNTVDPDSLTTQLVDYFLKICEVAEPLELKRMETIFDQLNEKIEAHITEPDAHADMKQVNKWVTQELEALKEKLELHCKKHVIYSFNGKCLHYVTKNRTVTLQVQDLTTR